MTVFRDHCTYDHACDPFGHTGTMPKERSDRVRFDYHYRCDECGQHFHVTGERIDALDRMRASPIGKRSRRWRRQHPGAVA